jgi:tRNA (guanine-N7-)-methyltransferase
LLEKRLPELRTPLPEGEDLDPRTLFPGGSREAWVEIGFGGGEHLAWQAEQHPGVGFLGCELFRNGIASLLHHTEDRGLANVRIADVEAGDLLETLAEGSVSRLFVLFPDPWPKTRHHKRRLIQTATVDRVAHALADSAEVRFATDHGEYARWALARFLAHPALDWTAERSVDWRIRPGDWPATRYEKAALAAGRPPFFFTFARRPR